MTETDKYSLDKPYISIYDKPKKLIGRPKGNTTEEEKKKHKN